MNKLITSGVICIKSKKTEQNISLKIWNRNYTPVFNFLKILHLLIKLFLDLKENEQTNKKQRKKKKPHKENQQHKAK